MAEEVNLKTKNTTLLWVFLAANIIILFIIFFPHYLKQFDIILLIRTIGASIAPILLFLLNGLLTSHQKAILVFWKLNDPLPGSIAFSKLCIKDSRIDIKSLKSKYGQFPRKNSEQNKLWYKLYKKNSANLIVTESHRAFLLARDLTSLSFLFIVFTGMLVLIFMHDDSKFYYVGFLFIQYLANVINAQNRGKRFVSNVLAVESNN
ncbi:hypothetical protein [Chryseobacterium sp. R2ACT005]|uniref:hypothetical protein n=1 Tax=Chryseobacterium sp. R2ACT005 TaxID=3416668 RepID=UPI003CF8A40E